MACRTGRPQTPSAAVDVVIQQGSDFLVKPLQIDNGMPQKDLWQSMGQTAYQTFSRSPDQLKFKSQFMPDVFPELKMDRIGTVFRPPEKGLKKLFRSFLGEQDLECSGAQNFFNSGHFYTVILGYLLFRQVIFLPYTLTGVFPKMCSAGHE
jgi:hypothetical protein